MEPGSWILSFIGVGSLLYLSRFLWLAPNLRTIIPTVMVVSKFVEEPVERFLSSVPSVSAFCMDFHWYESRILDDPLSTEPIYWLRVQAQSGERSRQFCFAVTLEQYNAAELWHYIENPFYREEKGRQHQPAAA